MTRALIQSVLFLRPPRPFFSPTLLFYTLSHDRLAGIYSEVAGLVSLLGYECQNAGCCKIVLHPQWRSAVYPASMFTKAPLDDLKQAINEAEKALGGNAQ